MRVVRVESAGTNHLGHFLLANLLLPEIQKAPEGSLKRVIIVGSITGAPRPCGRQTANVILTVQGAFRHQDHIAFVPE